MKPAGGLVVVLAMAFGAALVATAQEPRTALTPGLDRDGDGVYDELERTGGSSPTDAASVPEGQAFEGTCDNFADDDLDGLTDGADPGCDPAEVSGDLEARTYAFQTTARLEQGSLGDGLPPVALELRGPAVMRTGEPDRGRSRLEMVAMQLEADTPAGRVVLVEDPARASTGFVGSETGAPPFRSEIETFTLLILGGEAVPQEAIVVTNDEVPHLPPVQDSRKVDPERCYQFNGGLHCPEVPRLRIPVLKYVAKFDCGEQPSTPPPFLGAVKPGDYATKVVIHNPQGVEVRAKKKVAVGLRNPKHGPISRYEHFTLPPDAVTEVDCPDVFRLLGKEVVKGKPLPFLNGVVVVLSQEKLDVIANYTQETPKEKVEFVIHKPRGRIALPPELERLVDRRLKIVTLVTEDVIVDPEREVREALVREIPAAREVLGRLQIEILSDDIGVGSSMDVEAIKPQKCILVDPPDLPEGMLECEP